MHIVIRFDVFYMSSTRGSSACIVMMDVHRKQRIRRVGAQGGLMAGGSNLC